MILILNLGYDSRVCFSNTHDAKIVQKHGKPKQSAPNKVWFVWCIQNLVDVGWSIGIQLAWWTIHQTWRLAYVGIKKEPTISELTILQIHLMIHLETKTPIASKTSIVDLDAYELHLVLWWNLQRLYWWMLGIHIMHLIRVHYYSKVYLSTYVNDYTWR